MNIQIKDRLYDEFLKEPTKDNFCEFVKNNCGEFNEVDYKKTWPDKGWQIHMEELLLLGWKSSLMEK